MGQRPSWRLLFGEPADKAAAEDARKATKKWWKTPANSPRFDKGFFPQVVEAVQNERFSAFAEATSPGL